MNAAMQVYGENTHSAERNLQVEFKVTLGLKVVLGQGLNGHKQNFVTCPVGLGCRGTLAVLGAKRDSLKVYRDFAQAPKRYFGD